MKVYALFELYGDGDSYLTLRLLSVHSTEEGAKVAATKTPLPEDECIRPYSEDFTKENHYIVFGEKSVYDEPDMHYGWGGFLVSPIEVEV